MADRLLQELAEESDTETTVLLTPELADTIESMEQTAGLRGRGEKLAAAVGGWQSGMEVTHGVKLVRLIADGGMGSVWVADHARLKTQVAVKLVDLALLEKQPSLVERLDAEAAALGRLANTNIVEIFEHGTTADGTPYIVMELLEGVTMWQLVKRHGPLSLTEVAAIVEQAANGLTAAHGRGIIHRDIKPQNIFLFSRDKQLAVKLIDFGIAKEMEVNAISSVTKTGTLLGTPHFMSPEQLLTPKKVDARTDLWSLGVVAYHAMTRKFPFGGETLAALFAQITSGTYPPPSARCPHLPPAIDAWVERALAQSPQERFATARELSVAFKRAVLTVDEAVAVKRFARGEVALAKRPEAPRALAPRGGEAAPPPAPRPSRPEAAREPPRTTASEPDRASGPRAASPPAAEPKKKLLPYPFALMQDGDATAEPSAIVPVEEDQDDRRRRLLLVGAVIAVIALILVVLTR